MPEANPTPPPSKLAFARGVLLSAAIGGALAPLLIYGGPPRLEQLKWWGSSADVLYQAAMFKSLIAGHFLPFLPHVDPDLGFPFGLDSADFPNTFVFQMLLTKLLTLFSSDPFTVLSMYYLATFVLTAPAFYLLAVSLGTRGSTAIGFGVIYAFIPFHLQRIHHLFLTAHFVIPVATLLCVHLWRERPLFGRGNKGRTAWGLLAAALIGYSGVYYALFACLFFALAGLAAAWTRRSWAPAHGAGGLCATVFAALLLTLVPTFTYRAQHGPNPAAVVRSPDEVEMYGLRLGSIVLPPPNHRLPFFAAAARAYDPQTRYPIEGQTNEYIGAVALLGLLSCAALAWRKRPADLGIATLLVFLTLAAILYATPGGGASIIARLASPEIRSVNRISPFIACFGVLGAALYADRKLAHVRNSVRVALVAGIVGLALLDQVPSVPAHPESDARYVADTRAFYAQTQAALPSHAAILQLPYRPYPEAGWQANMCDYQHHEAFLFTDGLRFSYGAMKGRPGALVIEHLSRTPLDLSRLRNERFNAILVDRRGFPDRGAALERELQRAGLPKLVDTELRHRALYKL